MKLQLLPHFSPPKSALTASWNARRVSASGGKPHVLRVKKRTSVRTARVCQTLSVWSGRRQTHLSSVLTFEGKSAYLPQRLALCSVEQECTNTQKRWVPHPTAKTTPVIFNRRSYKLGALEENSCELNLGVFFCFFSCILTSFLRAPDTTFLT